MKLRRAYTLIEILVVIGIMGILFSVGFVNFRDYSKRKVLAGVTDLITGDLRLAQSDASSGQKPAGSGGCTATLDSYDFTIVPQSEYKILADCGATPLVKDVKLPSGITISTPFYNPLKFKALGQGTNIDPTNVNNPTWILTVSQTGTTNSVVITVTAGGQISSLGVTPTSAPTVAPTAAPTSPPTAAPTATATPTMPPLPTTPPGWTCGSPLTMTHTAGSIAPVSEMATYGTVSTSIGGTGTKCWITQNLGATTAANSSNGDPTTAIGWFWQFNLTQGYTYNLIPAWPSSYTILSSDWSPDKDPCTLLLGAGWRLPTLTEWSNAMVNGVFSSGPTAAFSSILKLYMEGDLEALGARGMTNWEYYASSNQGTGTYGYYQTDGLECSSTCVTGAIDSKSYGVSVRCIMDTSAPTPTPTPTMTPTPTPTPTPIPTCSPYGTSLTVTHTAGNIAPVTETVTYGVVSSSIGGTGTKCWITQNLGAVSQAVSATDTTGGAHGWYWQFNRKQGFSSNGSSITPAMTITSIDENSDWLAANDPCTLLLGTGWRLPTSTEWQNVASSLAWGSIYDAYNSVLKLHAAGDVYPPPAISSLGMDSYYLTRTQYNSTTGYCLYCSTIYGCSVSACVKPGGFTVRCIKD